MRNLGRLNFVGAGPSGNVRSSPPVGPVSADAGGAKVVMVSPTGVQTGGPRLLISGTDGVGEMLLMFKLVQMLMLLFRVVMIPSCSCAKVLVFPDW